MTTASQYDKNSHDLLLPWCCETYQLFKTRKNV